ncbi:hypothetical protein BDR06DRAFT_955644 [Suillus hirtellus]|nr:hypothetical protein BDR06DRAFT_955644 [Suillus hirtellus]
MPKEIGSLLKVFNGDTCKATTWSLQMEAYFLLNMEVYNEDRKKIILTLSRMMKGEAAKWAEGELKRATLDASVFDSYEVFTKKFEATFYPKNIAETTMR